MGSFLKSKGIIIAVFSLVLIAGIIFIVNKESRSIGQAGKDLDKKTETMDAETDAETEAETEADTGEATSNQMQNSTTTTTPTLGPTDIPANQDSPDKEEYVIVIDPGHQAKQNSGQEPIGPGAKVTKPKVSSGTQGRFTRKPEYEVNLEVSLKLRDILKQQGYKVIMVRETHNVNISNSERAAIANQNNADVFVRIHCNGSENPKDNGIFTMCSTKENKYCSQLYNQSRKLSECIVSSLCDITKAKNDGVMETDGMSGINWCEVPVTIVEMGFMTNKKEDIKLSNEEYQNKLAIGLAKGIKQYLEP